MGINAEHVILCPGAMSSQRTRMSSAPIASDDHNTDTARGRKRSRTGSMDDPSSKRTRTSENMENMDVDLEHDCGECLVG